VTSQNAVTVLFLLALASIGTLMYNEMTASDGAPIDAGGGGGFPFGDGRRNATTNATMPREWGVLGAALR